MDISNSDSSSLSQDNRELKARKSVSQYFIFPIHYFREQQSAVARSLVQVNFSCGWRFVYSF